MKDFLLAKLKEKLSRDNLFTTLQHIVPQQQLSEVAGQLASSTNPLIKNSLTYAFAKAYGISLEDYERKYLTDFNSFNDFFTRELSATARPIDEDKDAIISPADGVISQIGYISKNQLLQAKGRRYEVAHLLADTNNDEGHYYDGGSFATVYLAPSNYHRVHMPFDGKLVKTRYVPGSLFSVNNVTASGVPDLFARNERLVCVFETQYGRAIVVMVGAMIVAGIETVATGKIERGDDIHIEVHNMDLNKGDELGRFYLGSTAIIIMPKSAGVEWQDNLDHNSVIRMGERLGTANGDTDSVKRSEAIL